MATETRQAQSGGTVPADLRDGALAGRTEDVGALRLTHEPFYSFASEALVRAPLMPAGVCWNPICSKTFVPREPAQKYCSEACRKMVRAEMRKAGERLAPGVLFWRLWKSKAPGTPERAVADLAFTFVSRVTAEWRADRDRRRGVAWRRAKPDQAQEKPDV